MKAIRRIVLGSLVAAIAMLTALGNGGSTGAQNNQSGLDDWGSKADFEEFCGLIGGGFIDAPADNMTICVYPNGDREVCDQNGGNCTVFPKSSAPTSRGKTARHEGVIDQCRFCARG